MILLVKPLVLVHVESVDIDKLALDVDKQIRLRNNSKQHEWG
jgi:hypothetical protein